MTEDMTETQTQRDATVVVGVVDPDEVVRGVLTEHIRDLDDSVVAFGDLAAFTESIDASRPGVVVFGPSEAPTDVTTQVAGLVAFRPACCAIMVVYDLTTEVMQLALRAGVDDVVAVSADDAELLDAISRASARVLARGPNGSASASAASAPTPGRVVSVFCTKGGTGKSVVAINLAVALAKRTIQPVVLVDADLQFGDVALMLQLQPTHTIAEAVQAGDRLDGTMLETLLLRHPPSGLLVLAAPIEPSSADQIGRADLARILDILRERCAYIVVDTSANFAEVTLAAIESSDDILVMAGLDVMSLKSARIGLQTMRVLGIPFSSRQVRAQPGQHSGRAHRGGRRAGAAAQGGRRAAQRHLGGGVGEPRCSRGDERSTFEVRQEHRPPGGHAHDHCVGSGAVPTIRVRGVP